MYERIVAIARNPVTYNTKRVLTLQSLLNPESILHARYRYGTGREGCFCNVRMERRCQFRMLLILLGHNAKKNKMKRSRKARYTPVVHAELDLHGYTSDEARAAVDDFLHEAQCEGWTRVRIIVGKGTRSVGGVAVLPGVVKTFLKQRNLTYTFAKLEHGGEGALEISLH